MKTGFQTEIHTNNHLETCFSSVFPFSFISSYGNQVGKCYLRDLQGRHMGTAPYTCNLNTENSPKGLYIQIIKYNNSNDLQTNTGGTEVQTKTETTNVTEDKYKSLTTMKINIDFTDQTKYEPDKYYGINIFLTATATKPVARGTLRVFDMPFVMRIFHHDHLGSTRMITDLSGNIESVQETLAYGEDVTEPLQTEDGTILNKIGFTGHEHDYGTGFINMQARLQDPGTGKFLQPDPGYDYDQNDPMSWNLYGYCRSNPINYIDIVGELSIRANYHFYNMHGLMKYGIIFDRTWTGKAILYGNKIVNFLLPKGKVKTGLKFFKKIRVYESIVTNKSYDPFLDYRKFEGTLKKYIEQKMWDRGRKVNGATTGAENLLLSQLKTLHKDVIYFIRSLKLYANGKLKDKHLIKLFEEAGFDKEELKYVDFDKLEEDYNIEELRKKADKKTHVNHPNYNTGFMSHENEWNLIRQSFRN